MIGFIAIAVDISNVVSFFLSFFLSQMIAHNIVMMILRWCEEKNYDLTNELRMTVGKCETTGTSGRMRWMTFTFINESGQSLVTPPFLEEVKSRNGAPQKRFHSFSNWWQRQWIFTTISWPHWSGLHKRRPAVHFPLNQWPCSAQFPQNFTWRIRA